ncbi:hypothetical protein Ocepr_2033 [Oceanithermus profundus DSM 14977]|uniref:KTSC domain-containing protein n=1 Tax=Oceanithermus profundus (strain DSM 14977 / NBRC 100410 / VKM B-2274 / 506) TaxID=670487 RepID=E4U572_OCEP5|nr:hypothetical protein [Oceanithermus profundus]ADR37484.1 hypothetical protein Ocepr_2033 [Oceanithermus profundus DSM 14977]
MKRYMNLGGDSGVIAYSIGVDYIIVKFRDSTCYTYTYASAGIDAIEKMKALAEAGEGLNSYINRYVKYKYANKVKC